MTLVSESKSQRAYSLLHERILSGDYEPGQRLVLERIGRELDISVVPVREAIRRLEAEGLVTFERNVGARVAAIDQHEYFETVQTLSVVEGAAISIAAPTITEDDLIKARGLNAKLEDLLHADGFDPRAFSDLNERFHRVLSDRCPNSHLSDLVDRGWNRLARLRRSTFAFVPERAQASIAEHEEIINLIATGADEREIELAVREHRLATPYAFLHKNQPEAGR
ncbi:MAG TPA: GntR family transcriptional regulator [Candidatus Agrococcus pullicola]|uniref:GntR family transcriptional regulator n=1 Tax=Candidatus Agrococcus pullicola TaxID=2838429 RepID=A0A9D2CBE3_9MICO|nr:GntR family transcriptional regulator [Candidatus Agrococcus pullicola]